MRSLHKSSAGSCQCLLRVTVRGHHSRSMGQIGIDSAIFPAGTTGAQLDALARKSLWKYGMDYKVS